MLVEIKDVDEKFFDDIRALELNNEKTYLVEVKVSDIPIEQIGSHLKMISEIFSSNNIKAIIVPENHLKIYELENQYYKGE